MVPPLRRAYTNASMINFKCEYYKYADPHKGGISEAIMKLTSTDPNFHTSQVLFIHRTHRREQHRRVHPRCICSVERAGVKLHWLLVTVGGWLEAKESKDAWIGTLAQDVYGHGACGRVPFVS